MNPGRELDALVAEKVMGEPKASYCSTMSEFGFWRGADFTTTKPYSTDIARAWDVVEKLKNKGFSFFLKIEGDHYVVKFYKSADDVVWAQQKSCKVPFAAICLAALKAVGD